MATSDLEIHILAVIKAIRNSHQDTVYLYTKGQCLAFGRILETIFADEDALIFYSQSEGHIYTRIGMSYYDIRGQWSLDEAPDDLTPANNFKCKPLRWGEDDPRRLTPAEEPDKPLPACPGKV